MTLRVVAFSLLPLLAMSPHFRLLRPALLFPLLAAPLYFGCAKPKERVSVDPNLSTAFRLAESDPDAALAALAKVEKGEASQLVYVKGLAQESKGLLAEAAGSYQKAIELDPKGTEPRTALARVELLRGEIESAQTQLRAVVRSDAHDLLSRLLLAVCAETPSEKKEAHKTLTSWALAREADEKQAPLRAEYFLTLASVESDANERKKWENHAVSADIGENAAALSLSDYARRLNQTGLALSLLKKLASVSGDEKELAQVAHKALALGALPTARTALGRIPGNVRNRTLSLLRGRTEALAQSPLKAISHLKAARKLTKSDDIRSLDEVEYHLAEAHAGARDIKSAYALLQTILKRSPTHRASHLLVAKLDLAANNHKRAIARLERLLTEFKDDTGLLYQLAQTHADAKSFRDALTLYKKIGDIRTNDPKPLLAQAEMKKRLRNEAGALALYKEAAKRAPQSVEVTRAVSEQFLRMKKPAEAVSFASTAPVAKSKPIAATLLLADLYDTLKQKKELRRLLEKLVQDHPRSPRAWSALARIKQRDKDFPALEKALRQSLALNPDANKDKARLAALLDRTGQEKEAAKLFGELAQRTGNDLVALNNAAMLYSDDLGDAERAVAYAEKAHKLAPELPAVLDTLAWALYRRGTTKDLKRAKILLERALKRYESKESEYHYGATLLKLGQVAEGKSLLERSLLGEAKRDWHERARELLADH